MARRGARFAWWALIAALGVSAVYAGTWRIWALTVLTWSWYELCLCPTTCGVAAHGGRPCHRAARGRMFACTAVAGHQELKTDALWRLNGTRLRATYGGGGGGAGGSGMADDRVADDGVAPAHRKVPLAPSSSEHWSVERRDRLFAYAAVISLIATTVQTAVGLAAL